MNAPFFLFALEKKGSRFWHLQGKQNFVSEKKAIESSVNCTAIWCQSICCRSLYLFAKGCSTCRWCDENFIISMSKDVVDDDVDEMALGKAICKDAKHGWQQDFECVVSAILVAVMF